MNEFLFLFSIVFIFGMLLVVNKFIGEGGLIAWIAISTILAEIAVCKNVDMFGLNTNLGNVLFASNFLATDILAEYYSEKKAKSAVYVGVFFVLFYLVVSQIMIYYVPSQIDIADSSMKALFGLAPRVCITSVALVLISNILDIKLYSLLKKKTNGKYMWLRNNVSTILCNGLENYFFSVIAFYGIYDLKTVITIATVATLIEAIVAVCDTPFLYLAGKIGKKESTENE